MTRFRLYPDCIFVTGKTKFVILDLTRERYFRFNNNLRGGLNHLWSSGLQIAPGQEINALIEQLLRYELIFDSSSESIPFVALSTESHIAGFANTSVVEFNHQTFDKLSVWLNKLCLIGVRHIQFVSLEPMSGAIVQHLCGVLETSAVRSCEIIAPYHLSLDTLSWADLFRKEIRLKSIVLFRAPKKKLVSYGDNGMGILVQTTQDIVNFHSQRISERNFTVNIRHYSEALNHNPSFYKKVCVDRLGNIKNSLEQEEWFGNIDLDEIKDVVSTSEFQLLWNIRRDMVQPCSKCEFRYVCNYNGLLVRNNNHWELAVPCGYDPIAGVWCDNCNIK